MGFYCITVISKLIETAFNTYIIIFAESRGHGVGRSPKD
jgi:hypothetical protein